ncbi:MAG: right-handed parallel beta-helix repeat-containing protein, partial [Candidatus Thorarchaeota archaeon]
MKKLLLIISIILLFASPVWAEDYYFCTTAIDADSADATGGGDTECAITDCTTWGTPCLTIECANDVLDTVGDGQHDFRFCKDGDWDTAGEWENPDISGTINRLLIQAGGSNDANRVIVGAYDPSDGSDIAPGLAKANRPKIDGYDTKPASESYQGLIDIYQPFVTVENLQVLNSEGLGVRVWGDGASASDVNIYDLYINNTYRTGILSDGSDNTNIKWNELEDAARQWYEQGQTTPYSQAITVTDLAANNTVSHNYVHDTHGEGININEAGAGNVVEYNKVINTRSVGIYTSTDGSIIRYNLVTGSTETTYNKWTINSIPFHNTGIGVVVEGYQDKSLSNVEVYGNEVAFVWQCIGLANGSTPANDGMTNLKFYNNTCVDSWTQLSINTNGDYSGCELTNNIFACYSGSDCNMVDTSYQPSGWTFSYNYWSTAPIAHYQGVGDQTGGTLGLAKASGWRSITGYDIDGTEFDLQAGSAANRAGTDLGNSLNYGQEAKTADYTASPINVDVIDFDDFGWSIGADGGGVVYYVDCTDSG